MTAYALLAFLLIVLVASILYIAYKVGEAVELLGRIDSRVMWIEWKLRDQVYSASPSPSPSPSPEIPDEEQ